MNRHDAGLCHGETCPGRQGSAATCESYVLLGWATLPPAAMPEFFECLASRVLSTRPQLSEGQSGGSMAARHERDAANQI